MVEDMKKAGIDPALIHAFEETGMLVAEGNEDLITDDDMEEWHEAISEYEQERDGAITFTGHRMDVRDIMAMSNLVFSLSTKPESFGRTVREALSLGVPVVGYNHGGVGETLHAAYPAGRVAVGDLDDLESVTRELLEHPVEVAPQHFATVQDMVDTTLDLYRSLVAE